MSQKKILVADKEVSILQLLSTAFDSAGYETHSATNSDDARKILAQEFISVMFIDLGLEPMNGFDLCERIRKDGSVACIYALTRYGKLFGPHDIHEAGFDGYFAIPVAIQKILQTVNEAFKKMDAWADKSRLREIKHILIIDDDEHMRKMLRQMLELEGYTITEASNGQEGIENQAAQRADLIIMDIVMPRRGGVETMMSIKETDPEVNFIVVTGGGWINAEVEFDVARTLGARTLKKPFERKQLLSTIKQMQS